MPLATLRPKGQLTIPTQILQQWSLKPYEQVEVSLQNGVAMMVPVKQKEATKRRSITDFVGMGRGMWGDTPAEIQTTIHNLRDSWTR